MVWQINETTAISMPCPFHSLPGLFHSLPGLFHSLPGLFHSFPGLFHSFPGLFHSLPGLFHSLLDEYHFYIIIIYHLSWFIWCLMGSFLKHDFYLAQFTCPEFNYVILWPQIQTNI